MRIVFKTLLIIFAFSLGFHCSKEQNNKNGINLKIEITPKIVSANFSDNFVLTDRLYARIFFVFKTDKNFKKPEGRYEVFVNLKSRENKKISFNFNHSFKEANIKDISKWKSGEIIKYSKLIYIPKFLDNYGIDYKGFEIFDLIMGLEGRKAPRNKIILYKKRIRMEAEESHAPEIGYMKGWYGVEEIKNAKDREHKKVRWTAKKAFCVIDNRNFITRKDDNYKLIIIGEVSKGIIKDQKITVSINKSEIDSFIPNSSEFRKEYDINSKQIGQEKTFLLTFETDKTFIPSEINPKSTDKRELGIRIYSIYFRKTY